MIPPLLVFDQRGLFYRARPAYAQCVIVNILPDSIVDEPFSYLWPDDWPEPQFGQVVRIPFGKKELAGLVIAPTAEVAADVILKLVTKLIRERPYLGEREAKLGQWLAEYYLVSRAEALFALLPPTLTKRPRTKLPALLPVLKKARPFLTDEQQRAVQRMKGGGVQLLFGVTGSGKTEVYLELAEEVRAAGRSVLVLVPEISLTPQVTARFQERFREPIAVYHSLLTSSERTAIWQAVQDDTVKIVVGSRSAVLLPYQQLGLLVIDEEHDSSYHQEQSPHYDARRVAEELTVLDPTLTVVMGSATPRLETYLRARAGRIGLVEVKDRFGVHLPEVTIIDRRGERTTSQLLTPQLLARIDQVLQARRQIVLFLNRRGAAGSVVCRQCGTTVLCPDCELPLTYHVGQASAGQLICHHCGLIRGFPERCEQCQQTLFRGGQWGTESLEIGLKKHWPEARTLRLDRDTMTDRTDFLRIYQTFLEHKADILIGTTLVTKGWDIPNVQLVGVVAADQQLGFPDYQAAERTFALLTQVAGRAGRRQSGEVIVQTYSPEHPAVVAAAHHSYEEFVQSEIGFRRAERFPPYAELVHVLVRGRDEGKTRERTLRIRDSLLQFAGPEVEILGPAPNFFPKIALFYRFQLLLKIKQWPVGLAQALRTLQKEGGVVVQRNPVDLL